MLLKGIVSSIEQAGVRVSLPERENVVTPPLGKAVHVDILQAGDKVIVAFFSGLADGIIIAKY